MNKNLKSLVWVNFLLLLVVIACFSTAVPITETDEVLGVPPSPSIDVIAPTPVLTPTVQHVVIPPSNLPAEQSGIAGDQDSFTTAEDHRAPSGDRFTYGRYERPFNSETMDVYYPYLDIQTVEFFQDETWIYGVITLKGADASLGLAGNYGFEIDLNVDGGGDFLILAARPSTTDWSTDGVQVWFDEDNDVGGSVSVTADKVLPGTNGYEIKVFGDGTGDDVDLAWARISPTDPSTVQIAAKLSLLGEDKTYLVGMWAGGEDLAPALFDINDVFTHEQAGAALKEFEYFYPIKEVSELDNACRMAIGFQPSGSEPGLCPQPPKPGQPYEPTGCPAEYLVCYNFGSQRVCFCAQP